MYRQLTPESLGDYSLEDVTSDCCFIEYSAVLFRVWQVFFMCTSVRTSDFA